jgi:hypothetical protein
MRTSADHSAESTGEFVGKRPHAGVLAFPARLLAGLPAPVWIELIDQEGRPLIVATGPLAEAARQLGENVIDGEEWSALAEAAESDRVFASDLALLLGTRGPGKITPEAALAGARADAPRGWTVGTVLARLGLHVAPVFAVGPAANEGHVERRAA